MKREDLFEAIGGVEEALLEEYSAPPIWRRSWVKALVGTAACAAIVIAAIRLIPAGVPTQPDDMTETEIPLTESYMHAAPDFSAGMELKAKNYHEALAQICTEHNFGGITFAEDDLFAIADLNQDGIEELALCSAEGVLMLLVGYDADGKLTILSDTVTTDGLALSAITEENIASVQ